MMESTIYDIFVKKMSPSSSSSLYTLLISLSSSFATLLPSANGPLIEKVEAA